MSLSELKSCSMNSLLFSFLFFFIASGWEPQGLPLAALWHCRVLLTSAAGPWGSVGVLLLRAWCVQAGITPGCADCLLQYSWEGAVKALQGSLLRIIVLLFHLGRLQDI